MKFETFKAGRWHQRLQYKSFEPVPVNHDWQCVASNHWRWAPGATIPLVSDRAVSLTSDGA